eukprot:1136219-Pelagomonas_calceolata.AAC.2
MEVLRALRPHSSARCSVSKGAHIHGDPLHAASQGQAPSKHLVCSCRAEAPSSMCSLTVQHTHCTACSCNHACMLA